VIYLLCLAGALIGLAAVVWLLDYLGFVAYWRARFFEE
jgi:hypothetical protein